MQCVAGLFGRAGLREWKDEGVEGEGEEVREAGEVGEVFPSPSSLSLFSKLRNPSHNLPDSLF